jgi:thymidylate synthase (FAD)
VTDFGDMKNTVELVGMYGSDESHCLSAWTSTSRDLNDARRERMGSLLNMLASEGHHTPFEKSAMHFLVRSDIASHIHLIKHRIGVSINGESARYKELKEDKLYMPSEWPEDEKEQYIAHMEQTYAHYHRSLKRLTEHYMETRGVSKRDARKRAKESARFYLPYGNQLVCDIQFNFRSFIHFIGLRYSTHAQEEICDIARQMLDITVATGRFPLSLQAFGFINEDGKTIEPIEGNLFNKAK